MARRYRTALATTVLVAGIAWSLPTHVDDDIAGTVVPQGLVPAAFEVTAYRGTLTIAGHTASGRHETRLREAAAQSYPDHALRLQFRPLGLVPDWWTDVTAELLVSLATSVSPGARLTTDTVQIAALSSDPVALENRLEALEPLLPASVALQTRVTPAGPDIGARELCRRQFGEFHAGPIHFPESGTTLRTSAYPELDRIVMLADACRDATLTITGHTDASGSDAWNQQLSLDRARAVASYLANRGVNDENIRVAGRGSSVPVADNATRYGRGLNRRIDIRFSYED